LSAEDQMAVVTIVEAGGIVEGRPVEARAEQTLAGSGHL
jgi:hypothetical protein